MARPLNDTQQILLDLIGNAVMILDARQPTLPLLAHNRSYRNLFAAEAIPQIGTAWDNALSFSASTMVAPQLQALISDGTARTVSAVPFTANGVRPNLTETTYWDWQCQPTNGSTGTVEQIVITMTQVVVQKVEPEQQSLPKTTLATLVDGLTEGVFVLDRFGVIQEVNSAGELLLNSRGAAKDRHFGDLLRAIGARRTDEQPFNPSDDFVAPILTGHPITIEHLVIADGAGANVERQLRGAPIFAATGQVGGAVVYVRDNGAQQRTDKEKDTFLSLISHEIKSPLTSIKGFAQLAMRAIEVDDQPLRRAAKHLRVIEQQADRIGHLISDLSDVSRMQRGQLQLDPTVFDLIPIITVTIEQQQPALGTHRVTLKAADEPLIVRADPQRIQQLLGNLLSNAAKASPLADRIDVTIERHGDGVRLAVRDSGIGIAHEEQSRVFERFYRTNGGGGSGLGLGLYIAQQIARHSNGTLSVESTPGHGSVFCLDLPLAQPDGSTDDDY